MAINAYSPVELFSDGTEPGKISEYQPKPLLSAVSAYFLEILNIKFLCSIVPYLLKYITKLCSYRDYDAQLFIGVN